MPATPTLTPAPASHIETVRRSATLALDPSKRSALGQFMTPWPVARFMASLFTMKAQRASLLDAGAGVGSLSAAFTDRWCTDSPRSAQLHIQTFEIDTLLAAELRQTLDLCSAHAKSTKRKLRHALHQVDFIHAGTASLLPLTGDATRYTHAILNPPYAKINTDSHHRRLLSDAGIETVNLYAGFIAVAVALLETDGELVAIIPRSWCNGPYYRPFRQWLTSLAAIEHIHLFDSRKKAFKDDDVLQENVIVRWRRGAKQGSVTVSTSADASFSDYTEHVYPFSDIVHPGDREAFIHIPTNGETVAAPHAKLATASLAQIKIDASTGPVVDFRLKEHLRAEPDATTVPLLYPQHFRSGVLEYPAPGKKPNAIVLNAATRKWLYAKGCYVITKRFTAKEEKRRVVAHVIDPSRLPAGDHIAFENHVNVFHDNRHGLDPDLAHGLALFLNSTAVDEHFRLFSGHTQVNVTDLRRMTYPPRETLVAFGKWARKRKSLDQSVIDAFIQKHL